MLRAAAFVLLFALPAAAQDRARVATVNYPLAWMAERLGGEGVDVLFPVPAGTDPAFWRPAIADIAAFQQADVIALNGADYAQWVARASLPRARIVVTAAGFSDRFIATETVTHSHGSGGAHSHTGTASTTWLDFAQAALQAEALAAAMVRALPDRAAAIEAAETALQADLAALDARARTVAATLAETPMIASHPRYQYFARAYGLQIAALQWEPTETPTDAQIADLTDLVGETGARILLWEAAPGPEAAAAVAPTGLVQVTLPVLATRPATGDFLTGMTAALDALEAAAARLN